MNILKLIRFPGAFIAANAVIAGFYMVLFSGLGVERIGYLPQVVGIACLLSFANSIWNELFIEEDETECRVGLRLIRSGKVSMSFSYMLGIIFYALAFMLSMTVSFVTFIVVAAIILNSLLYNALLRRIVVLDAIFFSMEYVLLFILGISAHAYLYFTLTEPVVCISLGYVFGYFALVKVLRNICTWEVSAEKVESEKVDYEGDSIELSTEVDSVVQEYERGSDYRVAKEMSDENIKKDMEVLMPSGVYTSTSVDSEYDKSVRNFYFVFGVALVIFLLPVLVCAFFSFPLPSLAVLAFFVILLIFPFYNIISEKTISVCLGFYNDAIIASCVFNGLIVTLMAFDPLGNDVIAVVAVMAAMTIPAFVLKKYAELVV